MEGVGSESGAPPRLTHIMNGIRFGFRVGVKWSVPESHSIMWCQLENSPRPSETRASANGTH